MLRGKMTLCGFGTVPHGQKPSRKVAMFASPVRQTDQAPVPWPKRLTFGRSRGHSTASAQQHCGLLHISGADVAAGDSYVCSGPMMDRTDCGARHRSARYQRWDCRQSRPHEAWLSDRSEPVSETPFLRHFPSEICCFHLRVKRIKIERF